jgi:hypothetical protein
MNRRRFLVGFGGITVGLPFLRKFATPARAGGAVDRPTRVIFVAYAMGTHVAQWRPSATGSDFELGPITAPMAPYRSRSLFVSNTNHAALALGGNSYIYGHPAKKEAVFTGTLMQHAFVGDGSNHVDNVIEAAPEGNDRTPNGPSLEHVLGEMLKTPAHPRTSVDLGVWGNGGVQSTAVSDFFYESAANPVTLSAHPGQAFMSLFSGIVPGDAPVDEAFLALQRRKASVLDAVRDSFVDLRQGLDAQDQQVLDDHADKIRQIELDMPPLAACTVPDDIPARDDAYSDMSMLQLADLQNRLMAHAMGCGLAPVGRIEYLEQQSPYFGVPLVDDALAAVTDNDWHGMVHTSDIWPAEFPARIAGFTFFVERFAELCGHLDAIVEGPDGRTALDNSLLVLGSDYGEDAGHASSNLCFLVAGNAGPGRRNYHFDAGGENVNRVLNSIAAMARLTDANGQPVDEFGLQGFDPGPIPELLV